MRWLPSFSFVRSIGKSFQYRLVEGPRPNVELPSRLSTHLVNGTVVSQVVHFFQGVCQRTNSSCFLYLCSFVFNRVEQINPSAGPLQNTGTMGNLLGKDKPLKEILRENKRQITRAVRELDREKSNMEKEEKRLTVEIKKAARENQMQSVKIMAKDLVRTRQQVCKLIEMRSHLQGVSLKLQTVKSHEAMASAMRNTANAMAKMNKAVNVQTITKMLADFEKENARTEMMQEVMGDAIDDALGDDTAEAEEDAVVNQVLDEIGVSFGEELPAAAMGTPANGAMEAAPSKVATPLGGGDDPALSDLEARLNNLKK